MYTVPILVRGSSERLALCYEIHGLDDTYFNLISDLCVSVNAHYKSRPKFGRPLHIIDQVAVHASDSAGRCRNIEVNLVGSECRVTVDGQALESNGTQFSQAGVGIRSFNKRARITVPNCENVRLVMWVTCERRRGFDMIQFRVTRGFNLHPDSHGLVGKLMQMR